MRKEVRRWRDHGNIEPVIYDFAVADEEKLIPLDRAVELTHRGRRTLFAWIREDKLVPHKKKGDQRTYVDVEELLRVVATAKPGRNRSDS